MAVTITTQKHPEPKRREIFIKKHPKSPYKTRPITATLDHPLILDIKLLKKLDMTTFTKKGLMALSKFCGISLISKTDSKRKLNKCVKTIHYSKKQLRTECVELPVSQIPESNKKEFKVKRKLDKHISKRKHRIRFKIAKEDSSPDEDSLDVVCKKHSEVLKMCNQITNSMDDKIDKGKTVVNNILNNTVENIIPEPCKTCSRSEHPERFHSHPKMLTRLALQEKSNEKNLEERFRKTLTTKEPGGSAKEERKTSLCAKESENRLLKGEEKKILNVSSDDVKSPSKSTSSTAISSPETANKNKAKSFRNSITTSFISIRPKNETLKKLNTKLGANQQEEKVISVEEKMKFFAGCYICGKQLSPKSRMKHEKSCILEWRAQNIVSSGQRKPEPKRPDFRFTASGELDCEGSFESIWANHMDSLIPCKKCGRKFFPDRIEKHENCCNNIPLSVKYRH